MLVLRGLSFSTTRGELFSGDINGVREDGLVEILRGTFIGWFAFELCLY